MKPMMFAAVAALMLAACSKAPEDMTAHYSLGGRPDALVVKAAANGDARIDLMGATLIRHDGAEYIIDNDPSGPFAAKLDDFVAAAAEVMKSRNMLPPAPPAQPEFELIKQGTEEVAGLKGDVWKIQPKGPAQPEAMQDNDAVVAQDKAFAHVGKALAMQTHIDSARMKQMTGKVDNLQQRVEEMMGKGMVLRFGTALKLDKVEKTAFKAEDFALPKTVLGKDELRKRYEAMIPADAAAPGAGPAPAPAAPAAKAEPKAAPAAPAAKR